ncbi:DUF4333 domain-containing protein [Streptomyces violens]|uniref:DUF4333 domain-containing protein n=1 Tax=Streptomyces violens TaxID=66377 RepID=UPI0004C06C70|nr:DUF4333 domain-containing protein [Streptomyces violens]
MKRIVIALAVVAALALGAGIYLNTNTDGAVLTASGATHVVPRAEVEKHAEEDYGRPLRDEAPDSVSCEGGLQAKKAESVDCTAVFKGERKPMTISVTGVEGDEVTVDFAVLNKSA